MRVVIDGAAKEAEELVEAVLERTELGLDSEMPFADEARAVAVVLEQSRQGCAGRPEPARRIGLDRAKRPLDSVTLLILSSDEAYARRRTIGGVGVCVGEFDSLSRQSIEVRSRCVSHSVT